MSDESYLIDGMTWSYSRLTTYETCPYQFYLSYIAMQPKEEGFYSQCGQLVHRLLADFYTGRLREEELPGAYIAGFRKTVTAKPPSTDILAGYFQSGLDCVTHPWKPDGKIVDVEKKCFFRVGGYKFIGVIDLITEEDGGLVIVDHKSRNLKPRSSRSRPTKTDEMLDEYLRQLYLYAEAVRQTRGSWPIKLAFHCYRTGVLIEEKFDKSRCEAVLEWAKGLISTIRRENLWLSSPEFYLCGNLCGFRKICEHGSAGA